MAEEPQAQIASAFNECINAQDLECLECLMTHNHVFIDSGNNRIKGRQNVLKAWGVFFDSFPDYRNTFNKILIRDKVVVITGHSTCSNNEYLNGPALWTAKVEDHKVSEWRVYEDTADNRRSLGVNLQ